MTAPTPSSPSSVSLSTSSTFCLLVLVLVAYTVQTQLASYVQHELRFRKPFFLFYLTHSGYIFLTPLHLLTLKLLGVPLRPALENLREVLADKFSSNPSSASLPTHSLLASSSGEEEASVPLTSRRRDGSRSAGRLARFEGAGGLRDRLEEFTETWKEGWVRELARKVGILTLFISAPALSWYAAVPFTSMTDITAIYNSFAFWAYLLSVYYLPPSPSRSSTSSSNRTCWLNPLDLFSVLLAMVGVLVIAYGDGISSSAPKQGDKEDEGAVSGGSRLIGNGLALFGSVAFAAYEVWYKKEIALPEPLPTDPTPLRTLSRPSSTALFRRSSAASVDGDAAGEDSETSSLLSTPTHSPRSTPLPLPPPISPPLSSPPLPLSPSHSASPTTFLLYSTTLTSLIGLFTLTFFWLPLPLLHLLGWERFSLPPRESWVALLGIVGGGVAFNGGFMVLLAVWGPTVSSISNLLTLLLVALSDALFIPSAPPLTLSTLLGGGCIVLAFGGVIVGEVRARRKGGGGGEKEGEGV
ncbi:hypothetical protein JCM8547_005797 [Rhodosporidiobolus lusitaniae]